MLTIHLTKGLPASGKSTWAKKVIDKRPGAYKRVNKDDLRSMLDNSKWSKHNESFVLRLRNHIIKEALMDAHHVIVDDTNLHPKHERKMKEIIAELKNEGIEVALEIKDFTDVPFATCVERDLKRANSVGYKVIKSMYDQFLNKKEAVTKREPDPNLPNCIIVDIDGTLAIKGERGPFDLTRVGEDTLNKDIADIVRVYNFHDSLYGGNVFVFSGREDSCKEETKKWLLDNGIHYIDLVMRKAGDYRKDSIVKREMYEQYIENKYNVSFVLDDRNQVVDMWREELGLTCLQVAEGDF